MAGLPALLQLPILPREDPRLQPLRTGLPLDDISGGIPRGTLTELSGRTSSGLTSLLLFLLRKATSEEECCALIDAADVFDPESAAGAGVHLPHLLWVRCGGNVEHALKATDLLVRAGGFGMVALDLSGTPDRVSRRIPLASWFRLRHGAEQSGAALVVAAGQTQASSCSRLQLEFQQRKGIWSPKLLRGFEAEAVSKKRCHLQAASFTVCR